MSETITLKRMSGAVVTKPRVGTSKPDKPPEPTLEPERKRRKRVVDV